MPAPSNNDAAQPQRFQIQKVKETWRLDPHLQEKVRQTQLGKRALSAQSRGSGPRIDILARLKEVPLDGAMPDIPPAIQPISVIGDIVTGTIAVGDIETARKHPNIRSLKEATDLILNLHHSVREMSCDPAALQESLPMVPGIDGSGVLVGIVDVGFDFRHLNLRLPSGDTRLVALWDQTEVADTTLAPQPFGYGRELTATAINKALRALDPYEELKYKPDIGAHGTHVADVAAGNGREPDAESQTGGRPTSRPGVAPNASLICVHLKTTDHDFLGNCRHLLEAVDYIFRKADKLGMPAVVNLSLSTTGGQHDGTTLVELGFENLLRKDGRAIVVSAGNAYAQGGHVAGVVYKDQPFRLAWQTDPNAAKNEMEVWYGGDHTLEVTVLPPGGGSGVVALGQTADILENGQRVGRISHRNDDPNNGDNQIDIRVPRPPRPSLLSADPEEPWIVELSTQDEGEVPFHAWIEQDDRGTARFLGKTTSAQTLGSICCSQSTLTIGAYDTFEKAALALPYEATAEGPTRPGKDGKWLNKPDLSAPGVGIMAARAQGGTTTMSGTSMAAAHVTGLVALLFQFAERVGIGLLDTRTTRDLLVTTAQRSPSSDAAAAWDPRLGAGRANGLKALQKLLDHPQASHPTLAALRAYTPAPVGTNGDGKGQKEIEELLLRLSGELAKVAAQVQGSHTFAEN